MKLDLKTRTARFFLEKYNRSTIRAAVELAAQKERTGQLPGLEDYCHVPVDVEAIALAHRIDLSRGNEANVRGDALLLSNQDGHILRRGSGAAVFRGRFTIAHEIGHTLFLEGARHQIGVLSRGEMQVEEQICEMFAAALLMPPKTVATILHSLPDGPPWGIMIALEKGAKQLQVSLPALICRLGQVEGDAASPLIVLCLGCFPNRRTHSVPRLRVESCSSLGGLRDTLTWPNRSAANLGLSSAEELFSFWREKADEACELTGGRYSLVDGCLLRSGPTTLKWSMEKVLLDVHRRGKWSRQSLPMRSCSTLYAAKGWGPDKAYIVTLLTPSGPEFFPPSTRNPL